MQFEIGSMSVALHLMTREPAWVPSKKSTKRCVHGRNEGAQVAAAAEWQRTS